MLLTEAILRAIVCSLGGIAKEGIRGLSRQGWMAMQPLESVQGICWAWRQMALHSDNLLGQDPESPLPGRHPIQVPSSISSIALLRRAFNRGVYKQNSDLQNGGLWARYFREATLMSERARQEWVAPDLSALPA